MLFWSASLSQKKENKIKLVCIREYMPSSKYIFANSIHKCDGSLTMLEYIVQ